MQTSFIPRIAKHTSRSDQFVFFIASLCGVYDDLIAILSFGFLETNARAKALFVWFED